MEIITKKISELVSPEYNPRKISKKMMDKLKKSLTEFGYVEPIIWNKTTNHIVGGNQRFKALSEMGTKEVEVVVVELPLGKEKALNLALNKITGEWDDTNLTLLLNELKEFDVSALDLTGFGELEISSLLEGKPNFDTFDAPFKSDSRVELHAEVFYFTDPEYKVFEEFIKNNMGKRREAVLIGLMIGS